MHIRNRFPEWRQPPRAPRDAAAEALHLVSALPPERRDPLQGQLRVAWMSGADLRATLRAIHAGLADLPHVQALVGDLVNDLSRPQFEADHHANPYARTFETAVVASILQHMPTGLMVVARQAQQILQHLMGELTETQRQGIAEDLRQRLGTDIRPWFVNSRLLNEFFTPATPSVADLNRLLDDQAVIEPTDAVAIAHVAVRAVWSYDKVVGRSAPFWTPSLQRHLIARDDVGRSLPVELPHHEVGRTSGIGLALPGQLGFAEPAPGPGPAYQRALDWTQKYALSRPGSDFGDPLADVSVFALNGWEGHYPGACGSSGSAAYVTQLMRYQQDPASAALAVRRMSLLSMVHLVYDGGHSMREVMAGATPALRSPPWTPDVQAPDDVPEEAWNAFQDSIAKRYFANFEFCYDDVLALAASCDPESHAVVLQGCMDGFQRVVNEVDATRKVASAHRAAWEADGLLAQA